MAGALEHYSRVPDRPQDAFDIGALWQEMYRSQYFEGGRVLQAAISAIDIALHDIKGKALGVPVYQLLGGKQRDQVPTFATTGDEAGRAADRAAPRSCMATGWTGDPLLPRRAQSSKDIFEPRESIAATAQMLNKAREELGDDVVLGIDYHHRLSVAEAASFCQQAAVGARSTSSRSRSATRRRRPTSRCAR